MKAIFEKINEMQAAGIIRKYAIGGAVGATFYLEPSATLDVDIFAALPMQSGQVLISLGPIYDYLLARGGKLEGEYIVLDGWPVQFRPPADALDEEALLEAIETSVEGGENMGDEGRTLSCHRAANWPTERSRANSAVHRAKRLRQAKTAKNSQTPRSGFTAGTV